METILLILSFLLFTGFVVYITIRFGWLKSISASYFEFPRKQKWIFTIGEWAFVIPIMIAIQTPLMFMAGAMIAFSAAAADTRSVKMTNTVHNVGATGGIALAMADVVVSLGIWWVPVLYAIFVYRAVVSNLRNHTYWIEVVAYYIIFFLWVMKV